MDKHNEHANQDRNAVNDLLQFVLDSIEEIQRCVQSLPLPDEQSFTIDAVIEEVIEDILQYAKSKELL
ncbi:MAG: hypothetical protein KatS3mg020_0917 [Fimbriimonadales bacterium]|nr:MAG: hypothetical protein KatS3mg020_0019 [Fimbriimonadales bacterium]GIV11024.1 MAG: hypothetical protein KatS3mg020_0515 [Fimbriimonadales bacterium]GIV11426.1 MAG: hypothetical protein KatS3mg020_0917 [Fimbriimonadales bacterium]